LEGGGVDAEEKARQLLLTSGAGDDVLASDVQIAR
jgi:hypothetical protein